MEVVVVPGDIFHSNVWRKNRVEFDAVLVLCRTWFCNHLRHQWGPCPVNLRLPPGKKAFCPSSYGWTELPQTKLRLSGMATCAWSFFDLTNTKPNTERRKRQRQTAKSKSKKKKHKPVNVLDDAGWIRKRSGRFRRRLCGQTRVAALLRKK